jgi:hypothetical protein
MPGCCSKLNKEIYELLQDSLAAKVVLGILIVLMLGFLGGTVYSMLSFPTMASYIIVGFQGLCILLCIYVMLVGMCYTPQPAAQPAPNAGAPVRPVQAQGDEFQQSNPLRADASQNA